MQTNKHHAAFKSAVEKIIEEFTKPLEAPEMLAVSAQITGMLMALQDQNTMTVDRATDIVAHNMGIGSKLILADLMDHTAGTA